MVWIHRQIQSIFILFLGTVLVISIIRLIRVSSAKSSTLRPVSGNRKGSPDYAAHIAPLHTDFRLKDPSPTALAQTPNLLLEEVGEPEGLLTRSDDEYRMKANATLLSLVRNSELSGLLRTMKDVEQTFNAKFNYPWTFMNDVPFSEDFKRRTQAATKSECRYEVIPKHQWETPAWINPDITAVSADILQEENIMYAKLASYHRMCRWNSGMFYQHPALKDYRWYWRVEPNTRYFCSVDYDVFRFMEDNNKTYGFVINIYDIPQSIRTLWPTTLEFIAKHPEFVHPNNSLDWLTDTTDRPNNGDIANGYSTCHFWSNFEIGDMDFFRSDAYSQYFDYLDQAGGFFYERWGDAPIHSIGVGLFEDKHKIHWFKDIGYVHQPYYNCPTSPKCKGCTPGKFSNAGYLDKENCFPSYLRHNPQLI
ncbi:glycolipid 2-alpha-mannosyltransferase-domain-containing protein [Lipomyces oligophaga]|uniref:glycolipid 2-alpha-mannosyltransferase-domain-containing protein n=1 Tax=Lipomyces oligophaga TaxID=45792 RepID=UPI0034CD520D